MSEDVGSIYIEIELEVRRLLDGVDQVNRRLNSLPGAANNASSSFNRAERSADTLNTGLSKLASTIGVIITASALKEMANMVQKHQEFAERVQMATSSQAEFNYVQERLLKTANGTFRALSEAQELYITTAASLRSMGYSTSQAIDVQDSMSYAFVKNATSADKANTAISAFSKVINTGKVGADQWETITSAIPSVIDDIATASGKSSAAVRALGAAGKLSARDLTEGLKKSLEENEAAASGMSNTLTDATVRMNTAITEILVKVENGTGVLKAFTSGIISAADSMLSFSRDSEGMASAVDTGTTALTAMAVVLGARVAGAMAAAGKAKLNYAAASIAQNKASLASAKSAELEAGAKSRLAAADKSAAISDLNAAERKLNLISVTNGQSIAEVRLSEAQANSIRTQLAQIQSEKALEVQRLSSQISEQGRIATATRMAQLQQASAVLNKQLAAAEASTAQIKAAAIVAAEAEISAARMATANATGAASAANGAYSASQAATVIATRNASVALGLLKAGLNFIGGPMGVAMIAGAAIYYWWQTTKQAKEEALAFADGLDQLNKSMQAMTNTQLRGTIADTSTAMEGQQKVVDELEAEIEGLKEKYQRAKIAGNLLNSSNERAADIANQLAKKTRDLDAVESKLARTKQANAEATRLLNNSMLSSMGMHDGLTEKSSILAGAQTLVAKAFNDSAASIEKANQASQNYNPQSLQIAPATPDGDKMILSLEEQNKLLKIKDERTRAVTKAEMEMAKVSENSNQITGAGKLAGENFDLQKAEEARKKAQQEANGESKKSASGAESVAEKLANMKQQSEQAAGSTLELSRAQAILTAQQSLGKAATEAQRKEAGEYAAAKWDLTNAIKAQAAAENLLPERQENTRYTQETKDLKNALDAKKISRDEYNIVTEKAERQHQSNLAKIRSEAVISPQQENAGLVDPVQQLANENARKMALIQQFEADKTITEQQGLALRNAANQQFEQQRIAAQWEIWRQQSTGNEAAAAAFDSFAGNASNAFTGILTGSMSASDAMRSLGSTVLNSVINTFVQMGVEQARAAIMGASVQQAAIATTTAAQIGGVAATTAASTAAAGTTLAAWLPAALVASVGSFGAAAIIGGGALVAAFALSSALGRKNGGPVSAGNLYEFGEGNLPEMLQMGGKNYMLPGNNGRVFSNKDSTGAPTIPKASTGLERMQQASESSSKSNSSQNASAIVNIVIENNGTPQQIVSQSTEKGLTGQDVIRIITQDANEKGPILQSFMRNTTANPRLGG